MKSAAETLTPTRVKLTVEVPYEELKPSIEAAYKTIGSQVTIPGFRKGKVPSRIIDQRVGRGAVMQEAINESLPELYGQAVEEAQVRPIGQPEVEVTSVPMDESQPLTFTAEVDVRPEISLPELDGLAVTVDDVTVSEDDIAEELEKLRTRFGTLVGVERAAQSGDFVSMDLSATIGDQDIDAVQGVSYEVGSGNMIEGLDDALVGMSAGESKEFEAPLAGGDRAGEAAQCTVTVQAVKERQLPDLDDDFAQLASEFDTLDELKGNVSEVALQSKKFEQGIQARDRILDQLLETIEVAIPENIVEQEVHSHLEGEGRLEDDEHRAEVQEQTRKALKTQFILDALVEKNEVGVSQEEFVEYLIMQAQQYRMDPNEFAQALDSNNQVPGMVAEVARRKALAGVLDNAVITDASGNTVDLAELGPDEDEVQEDSPAAPAGDAEADADGESEGDASEGAAESEAPAAEADTADAGENESGADEPGYVGNHAGDDLDAPKA